MATPRCDLPPASICIDLLVSRHQIGPAPQAPQVLRAAGCAPKAELSPDQEQIHLRVDSVFNLSRPAPEALQEILPHGFALELHWATTSPCLPFDLDFEAVKPNLSTISLPGVATEKAEVRALFPGRLIVDSSGSRRQPSLGALDLALRHRRISGQNARPRLAARDWPPKSAACGA